MRLCQSVPCVCVCVRVSVGLMGCECVIQDDVALFCTSVCLCFFKSSTLLALLLLAQLAPDVDLQVLSNTSVGRT